MQKKKIKLRKGKKNIFIQVLKNGCFTDSYLIPVLNKVF